MGSGGGWERVGEWGRGRLFVLFVLQPGLGEEAFNWHYPCLPLPHPSLTLRLPPSKKASRRPLVRIGWMGRALVNQSVCTISLIGRNATLSFIMILKDGTQINLLFLELLLLVANVSAPGRLWLSGLSNDQMVGSSNPTTSVGQVNWLLCFCQSGYTCSSPQPA